MNQSPHPGWFFCLTILDTLIRINVLNNYIHMTSNLILCTTYIVAAITVSTPYSTNRWWVFMMTLFMFFAWLGVRTREKEFYDLKAKATEEFSKDLHKALDKIISNKNKDV